jgi:hypothetical protein
MSGAGRTGTSFRGEVSPAPCDASGLADTGTAAGATVMARVNRTAVTDRRTVALKEGPAPGAVTGGFACRWQGPLPCR